MGEKFTDEEIEQLIREADLDHDGEINYTEFLAVTVDRRKAITQANLTFAFHHFDIDNTGYITEENLAECFRREGKHFTHEELTEILSQVQTATPGQINFEEFQTFMREILNNADTPTALGRN